MSDPDLVNLDSKLNDFTGRVDKNGGTILVPINIWCCAKTPSEKDKYLHNGNLAFIDDTEVRPSIWNQSDPDRNAPIVVNSLTSKGYVLKTCDRMEANFSGYIFDSSKVYHGAIDLNAKPDDEAYGSADKPYNERVAERKVRWAYKNRESIEFRVLVERKVPPEMKVSPEREVPPEMKAPTGPPPGCLARRFD